MNDMIKRFAQEVGIDVEYLTNTKQIVLIEKFAENIIRQCGYYADSYPSLGSTIDTSIIEPSDYIKEKFGIVD